MTQHRERDARLGRRVTDTLPGLSAISCPESHASRRRERDLHCAVRGHAGRRRRRWDPPRRDGFGHRAVDHGRARNVQRHHSGDSGTRDRGDAVVEPGQLLRSAARQLAFSYLVTNSGQRHAARHRRDRPADRPVGDQLSEPDARAGRRPRSCTASYTTTAADVKAKSVTRLGHRERHTAQRACGQRAVQVWSSRSGSLPKITSAKLTTVPRQTHVNFSLHGDGHPGTGAYASRASSRRASRSPPPPASCRAWSTRPARTR